MKQAAQNAKEQENAIKALKQKEKDHEMMKNQRLQHEEQERKRAELALKAAKSVEEYKIPSIKKDKTEAPSRKVIDYKGHASYDQSKEKAASSNKIANDKRFGMNTPKPTITHRVHHSKKGVKGDLVALNTSKRDLRTVEEIQLEMKKETAASRYHEEIKRKREEALRKKQQKIEAEQKQNEQQNSRKLDYKEQRQKDREELERRKLQVMEQKAKIYSKEKEENHDYYGKDRVKDYRKDLVKEDLGKDRVKDSKQTNKKSQEEI
jgi:hypothetical protein